MAKKQKGTDLDDIADNNGGKRARIDDKIALAKYPEGKWLQGRLFGSIFTYGGYWVKTKRKDGKPTSFYVSCPSYDPQTQQRDSSIYDPWRDLEAKQIADDVPQAERLVRFAIKGFINGIVRSAEKDRPRKVQATKAEIKSGFKDKDSDSWTPVFAFPLGKGALGKLKEQGQLNTREVNGQTKVFPLTHEKNGRDVRIKYDSSKSPADQYTIVMGDKRTPLTDEQKEYLVWDLSDLEAEVPEAEVKRDFESWASRNGIKVPKKGKKSKDEDDDEDLPDDDGDDDGDDDDEDDEDEDEDDKKSKGKKKGKGKDKPAKKGKKSKDDDDEDDFDDDDDEDEDDKKGKGKGKSAKKGKKSKDDDDDEDDDSDDDDEDDDEDEDEDDKKSKSKKKGKKQKDDDDDDDEDEDDSDDDEDEDDEDEDDKKSKSKKKSKAPVKGKGKKKKDDDDDFDDDEDDDSDDEDEDEDDEDDKKSKSKKKGKGKDKPAKGKKKKDDDDDDDEDDSDDDEDDDTDDFDDDEDEDDKKSKKKSKGKKKK